MDTRIKSNHGQKHRVLTSANSQELAERIKQASEKILARNYNLYKRLENK